MTAPRIWTLEAHKGMEHWPTVELRDGSYGPSITPGERVRVIAADDVAELLERLLRIGGERNVNDLSATKQAVRDAQALLASLKAQEPQ